MRRNRGSQCLFGMIVLATVLATSLSVRAQVEPQPTPTPAASPIPSLERDFFKNILRDQKAIWTAPLHLERSDAKWMVPSGIGLMALFTTDRITGDEIAESNRPVRLSRIVSQAGSVYGLGAVAGSFYFLGRKNDNARARETGLLSAEALLDSLIAGSALKGITQRARPLTGIERSEFFDGGNSFPSGHSAQAWAVATIIANEYHHHRSIQIAAYGVASAVSAARFTGHKHYLSDVLAGSALGFGIGKYVYHTRHRDLLSFSDQDEHSGVSWWPMITPQFSSRADVHGLRLTWSF